MSGQKVSSADVDIFIGFKTSICGVGMRLSSSFQHVWYYIVCLGPNLAE